MGISRLLGVELNGSHVCLGYRSGNSLRGFIRVDAPIVNGVI
jgi:hypothetical protein